MPALSTHPVSSTTKLLLIGDTGSGKTGALASLASAGYNIRIADLDNGIDVLKNILMDSTTPYAKDAYTRVHYQTITDPMRNVNGRLVPRAATAWTRLIKLLENWKTDTEDFGPITTWSPKDVLVLDSLTFVANAAMNFILSMNARLGQQPHQSDWYHAQQLLESLIQTLYDESIKCNIVVNCHITYIGEDNGPQRGYPATLGRALSPKVGRYFNTMLMARAVGSGTTVKRKLLTNSQPMIELKNTAPLKVKAEYDLATGLAEYFRDVQGPQRPLAGAA